MTYSIRYQHTSSTSATSLAEAKRKVRAELGQHRLVSVTCDDGIYCYRSAEDRRMDDTGERAAAVICQDSE